MAFEMTLTISAILAIIFGILILIWPKLLRVRVGFYLLIVGVIRLVAQMGV